MNLSEKFREISARMAGKVASPAREAEILVTGALGIDRAKLHSEDRPLDSEAADRIDEFVARRLKGEPTAYITGHIEFMGLRMEVGKGVLIPRPETELMVEEALRVVGLQQPPGEAVKSAGGAEQQEQPPLEPWLSILDLCTGSGCVAIAFDKLLSRAVVCAVDSSDTALTYAVRNAELNDVSNIIFIKGDLFSPFEKGIKFGLIISNPPYIRSGDIDGLQVEIRDYEPREALDGGPDGLDFYRRIFADAPHFMKDDGLLMLEIGAGQAGEIQQLASAAGLKDIRFIKDYSGTDRIFSGRK